MMAKRRNRMLGYGGHVDTVTDVELGEDEVWSMIDDAVDRDEGDFDLSRPHRGTERSQQERNRSSRWTNQQARQVGGLSLAFDDVTARSTSTSTTSVHRIVHQFHETKATQKGRHAAASAPLNVPNWGNMYRVGSVESIHDSDEDYDSERIPPHEYLARSRKSAATSVFEGVGRTLKGRDMSRVRDAVWSQTGFDG